MGPAAHGRRAEQHGFRGAGQRSILSEGGNKTSGGDGFKSEAGGAQHGTHGLVSAMSFAFGGRGIPVFRKLEGLFRAAVPVSGHFYISFSRVLV